MATPPNKKSFTKIFDELTKQIDVDDSVQRSVPTNMNFVDEGFLTKDTGFVPFGNSEEKLCHSPYNYKKKDGTNYIIRGKGTKLQVYSTLDKQWSDIGNSPTFTENAEFGYSVYDDDLYLGNAVESLYKWDGTTFTEYNSAPKGNVLEVFEDRMFITGVIAEPLTLYYSAIGDPTDWTDTAKVIKPLGTDVVKTVKNYYGFLMVFKRESIWKISFVYDQLSTSFIPKFEQQSGNYGAASRKSVVWVENDLWFYTGDELRSIGYTDQLTGVFGINKSVLSNQIKETLKTISVDNYEKIVMAYNNRRFYLGVPLNTTTVDVVFVSHLLYNKVWTKYSGRTKSKVNDFIFIDNVPYTTNAVFPYGLIKWEVTTADTEDINNNLILNE